MAFPQNWKLTRRVSFDPLRLSPAQLILPQVLDEAFPEITIDLVLIQGTFDPMHLGALSHHLNVPQSLMFMTCPGSGIEHSVADLGTRVIVL